MARGLKAYIKAPQDAEKAARAVERVEVLMESQGEGFHKACERVGLEVGASSASVRNWCHWAGSLSAIRPHKRKTTMKTNADPFEREREALDALDVLLGPPAEGAVPAGYLQDAKGHLVPERLVPAAAALEDTTVRTIAAYALDLHRQIHRFVAHSYDDLAAMDDLVAEKYGLKRRGGAKGNRTYTSFDGCLKISVQIQDHITLGPELQAARELVEQCIADWSEGAGDEIQTLARHAFDVDKQGNVSREKVFALRRLEIDDERWRGAQAAITDAIRVVGSARYIRFYVRPTPEDRWTAITVDTNGSALPETL